MLNAMTRPRRFLAGEIQDALDAQRLVAVPVEQHRQPDSERRPINGLLRGHDKGADALPMASPVEITMRVVMRRLVMRRLVMRRLGVRIARILAAERLLEPGLGRKRVSVGLPSVASEDGAG